MKEPVKREPVPVTVEIAPVSIHAMEPEPGRVVGQTPMTVKRPMPPIDDDGWRECAREDCGARFKPDMPSRCFCSDACAAIMFYREHGMHAKAALMAAETPTHEAKRDPVQDAEKDERYGPLRTVDVVVSERGTRQRVRFKECKHEKSVGKGTQRSRCRVCKNESEKKIDVDAKKIVREPVRTPVPIENEEKKTQLREPVRRDPVEQIKKFVERGRAAQKAVNKIIKKETKKLAKKKPVTRKPARKPVKAKSKRRK